MIIVFEGLHGCGKTTQIHLLKKWLEEEHGSQVNISEWNSHHLTGTVTNTIKDQYIENTVIISLSHALDLYLRLQDLKDAKDQIVIFDRYYYSQMIRDSIRGLDMSFLTGIFRFIPTPDIVFYLDIAPEDSLKRIEEAGIFRSEYILGSNIFDNLDKRASTCRYFTLQREKYIELFKNERNCHIIDANLSIHIQFQEICRIIKSLMPFYDIFNFI